MQGVMFRKYIRATYVDLELFARDLAFSLREDGAYRATSTMIVECFEASRLIARAEKNKDYTPNTVHGCFDLYSNAAGLIGTRMTNGNSEQPYIRFHDDSWVDEAWPTVSAVVDHFNAQMMNALVNHAELDICDVDPERKRVNDYIDAALGDPAPFPELTATMHRIF